jgi:PAS domain S-box-containing protein
MNKISSLKHNELKLKTKHFKDIVDSSPEAIFVYVDAKIIFANNTALQLLKAKNPQDVIGKDVFSFVPEKSYEALRKVISLVIQNRKNYISNEDRI